MFKALRNPSVVMGDNAKPYGARLLAELLESDTLQRIERRWHVQTDQA